MRVSGHWDITVDYAGLQFTVGCNLAGNTETEFDVELESVKLFTPVGELMEIGEFTACMYDKVGVPFDVLLIGAVRDKLMRSL